MGKVGFFATIEPFDAFEDVFTPARYQPLPAGWLLAVCDIQGSTSGIARGRYKEINMVGASAVIAVLNSVTGTDLPYVFGGDGATFGIPPDLATLVAEALRGTQVMAREAFGLTLRAGLVPVMDVRKAGFDVRVARYRLSNKVSIAMFDGGGLTAAEQMLKDPQNDAAYDVTRWAPGAAPADFSGLECRWNPLKASRGQIVTLIVRTTSHEGSGGYFNLFRKINEICGDQGGYCPVGQGGLRLSFAPEHLKTEHSVRSHGLNLAGRVGSLLKMTGENLLGALAFRTGIQTGPLDGKNYRGDVVRNADFQKFDDTLRMVMDNTPDQIARLTAYLDEEYKTGRIYYGAHIEEEAMITCLIFDRADRHLHFVDGAQGGYAAAAQALKAQIAAPRPTKTQA